MPMRSVLLVVGLLTTSCLSLADVRVVESSAVNQASATKATTESSITTQLFLQLQTLQETVMHLQGQVEQQQHEIVQLKQQINDNYLNLDKRLSQMQTPAAKPIVETNAMPVAAPNTSGNDQAAYQAAYDLITQRKFDQAQSAFQAFIKQYPQSNYQANAYYWLGELYIVDGDNDKAKQAFQTILKQFPKHNKYPEALYKIASLNYDDGKKDIAKQQLDNLIGQFGQQAAYNKLIEKAKQFLQKNYP